MKCVKCFTIGHNELRDKVDVPVSIVAILFGWLLAFPEDLVQIGNVHGGAVSTVIRVTVDVQHFLALHREQSR